MFDRTCTTCSKNFKSQKKDSTTCYGCALERITGGNPPEEGDLNTALLTSGEMSVENARSLQDDLESIDHSREEEFERRMMGEHDWSDCDYFEDRDEEE